MDGRRSIFAYAIGFGVVAVVAVAALPAFAVPAVEVHDARVLVEAPSEVVAGESVPFSVLLQEEWGREGPPAPWGVDRGARLEVAATDSLAEIAPALVLERTDRGFKRGVVTFRTPGIHSVLVDGETGISGRSNPIRVLEAAPAERVYWGDLHAHLHGPGAGHAGELDLDEYAGMLREGFAFARDASLLDFAAFTEHIQTAGGLGRERPDGRTPWDVIRSVVEASAVAGNFVTFPGFEWQGDAGDHCVIYPSPHPLDAPADFDALVRSATLRGALLSAHAVFLPSTFDRPNGVTSIEVTRDSKSTEWLGKAALVQGVVRPFLGCSDTHGGALGATSLTGLRAPSLGRAEILRAIRTGRCWATNGERIVLDVVVDSTGPLPRVDVRGLGTARIDRIEIHRDGELVAEGRGFDGEAFEFQWEDTGILRADGLNGPVAYHARVVQTSFNRYDPSERDIAISSPVALTPTAAQLDAAHAMRGGKPETAPGASLELLRQAWARLGPGAGRPPQAQPSPGAALPAWTSDDVASLRSAVRSLERLAAQDTSLATLARNVAPIPDVAAAIARLAAVQGRLRKAAASAGPTTELVELLRNEARQARVAVDRAETQLAASDRAALDRAWFAPRLISSSASDLLLEVQSFATSPAAPQSVVRGDAEPVTQLFVPIDPRTAARAGAVSSRARELHERHEAAWGYTAPSEAPGAELETIRLRVVAEGAPQGAHVVGSKLTTAIPLRSARTGWTAVLPATSVPSAGEPPLEIALDPPARVSRVFVESAGGAPLRMPGRVANLSVEVTGELARVQAQVADDRVFAELVAQPLGETAPRVLWSGVLEPGSTALAFPVAALGDLDEARLRWGFGGWSRRAGIEVPGTDVATPSGFGALADGRAVIALAEELVAVDVETGNVERIRYPENHRHEPGREFSAAPLPDATTIIRGADGATGSWVAALSSSGQWTTVPAGPEAGTITAHPQGGIAWLVGNQLFRRAADGTDAPPRPLDATGRLLAIDTAGNAIIRTASGETVRASVEDGRILDHIEGVVLGVDASGALLLLDGMDRRHAEIATGARVVRALPGVGRSEAFPLAVKPSATLDPPILAMPRPDGAMLVLGGAIGWRRAPDHAWWGASVDLWDPVWVGETALR